MSTANLVARILVCTKCQQDDDRSYADLVAEAHGRPETVWVLLRGELVQVEAHR